MFHKNGDFALLQQVPGFVDDDELLAVSLAQVHLSLNLVDELQEHHLAQMFSALELVEFEHREVVAEVGGILPVEEAPVCTR